MQSIKTLAMDMFLLHGGTFEFNVTTFSSLCSMIGPFQEQTEAYALLPNAVVEGGEIEQKH